MIYIALSLVVSTLNLALVRSFHLPLWSTFVFVLSEIGLALWIVYVRWSKQPASPTNFFNIRQRLSLGTWITAGVFVVVSIYLAYVGPYLEVPADAWWHVGRYQNIYEFINHTDDAGTPIGTLYSYHLYGYFLPVFFTDLLGYEVMENLAEIYFANTILFLAGFYAFSLFIFKRMKIVDNWLYITAAASTFFLVSQFGVNIFSYVRYYVYAPGYLNYLVYLSIIVLFVTAIEGPDLIKRFVIIGFCLGAATLVHQQEAVFACLAIGSIVVVSYVQERYRVDSSKRGYTTMNVRLNWLFFAGTTTTIAFWIYSYLTRPRSNPLAYHAGISLDQMVPFLKNLYILNPTIQFFDVVTIWGILVYVLFFLDRGARRDTILLAGMLMPMFTVFNPFFVDLFLRYNYSDVLWRFSFMIPLPLVGSYVLVNSIRKAIDLNKWSIRPVSQFTWVATIGLLFLLLLPFSTTFVESKFSRLPTLTKTDPGVGHHQWQELFGYLSTQDKHHVLTDQVTGYLINALTEHEYRGHKFYGFGSPNINLKVYGTNSFTEYAGWLMVLNRKDGDLSANGARARHWPENILKMSRYYSEDLINHVESNPQKFIKLWGRDNMTVYKINA